MPKTVSISGPTPGGVIANQPATFTVSVSNTDASAVYLTSLVISEVSRTGSRVGQPRVQAAGEPAGVNPTLNASGSLTYPFQVVAVFPNTPGVSPNNPGGAAPSQSAYPVAPPLLQLQAQGQTSDGSVFFCLFTAPVLSAVAPFPVPTGGAAQFAQGFDSNLIAVIS